MPTTIGGKVGLGAGLAGAGLGVGLLASGISSIVEAKKRKRRLELLKKIIAKQNQSTPYPVYTTKEYPKHIL